MKSLQKNVTKRNKSLGQGNELFRKQCTVQSGGWWESQSMWKK